MPIRSRARFDPYKSFKFRVKWGGRYVAGIRMASPLRRSAALTKPRASSRKSPGMHKFPAITLKRGMIHDPAFAGWVTGKDERARRNITIEQYDDAGRKLLAYKVRHAWVSEFQGMPTLDASAHAVAIEALTLENEGYKRDDGGTKPKGKRARRKRA